MEECQAFPQILIMQVRTQPSEAQFLAGQLVILKWVVDESHFANHNAVLHSRNFRATRTAPSNRYLEQVQGLWSH